MSTTTTIEMPAGYHDLPNQSQASLTTAGSSAAFGTSRKNDVKTTLNFYKPNEDGSPPAPAYMHKPETFERPPETHEMTIMDVSGHEDQYDLDSHGFQFVAHTSEEKDFSDDDRVKTSYYKELDQLLKDVLGASRTFIFDHTVRRPSPSEDGKPRKSAPLRDPVYSVHVDQSYDSALSRVSFHLPEDAAKLLKGRVQIVNVWRPIKTVKRDPLGVAHSQTVPESDLVPIGVMYPNGSRKGETLSVKYSEGQRWYYKRHQTPEEVLLVKCFDNQAGACSEEKYKDRAKRVPHSAFEIPGTQHEEGRESIEVRCLVFYE